MFKKTRIEVAEFIEGEYVFASDKKAKDRIKAAGATALVSTVVPVRVVFAENFDVFRAVFDLALTIVDFVVVLVIIFASSLWILGNRSRAMEILIGAGGGYILARNAVHIRNFMRDLVPDAGAI